METMTLNVNGREVDVTACHHESLAEVLRERLGLRGTKMGCASSECGACTVMVDGDAVNACITLVGGVDGSQVTTVEGLASDGALHKLQQAFLEHGAFQCGYCTSGMLMSATALLRRVGAPTDAQVRDALQGNICRCTGYVQILSAVRSVIGEPA